jgi:thioredoxin 1
MRSISWAQSIRFIHPKILFVAGSLLVLTSSCTGQGDKKPAGTTETVETAKEISFIEGNWDEAIKKASAEHKMLFVDAYATWCGPCKLLKKKTFTDEAVADYFNSHFVNLSLDVEKGQGPELAEKWKIQALPTLMIINPADGKIVSQFVGYIDPEDLIEFAKKTMTGSPQP